MDNKAIAIREKRQRLVDQLFGENKEITPAELAVQLNISYQTATTHLAVARAKNDLVAPDVK